MLEHVAMYVARLRSGGRKHYNMRSVLRGIFWNAHSVLCMSGAAGDGRTIHTYIYIYILVSCRACSGASLSSGAMSRSRFLSADETNIRIKPPRLAALDRSL